MYIICKYNVQIMYYNIIYKYSYIICANEIILLLLMFSISYYVLADDLSMKHHCIVDLNGVRTRS